MGRIKVILMMLLEISLTVEADMFTRKRVLETENIRICQQHARSVVTAHSEIECVLSCKILGMTASSFYQENVLCTCLSASKEACIRDELQNIKTTDLNGGSEEVKNKMITLSVLEKESKDVSAEFHSLVKVNISSWENFLS